MDLGEKMSPYLKVYKMSTKIRLKHLEHSLIK